MKDVHNIQIETESVPQAKSLRILLNLNFLYQNSGSPKENIFYFRSQKFYEKSHSSPKLRDEMTLSGVDSLVAFFEKVAGTNIRFDTWWSKLRTMESWLLPINT